MAMGMRMRVGVIVGVGGYHGRMLYCNIQKVYQARRDHFPQASPANRPIIDRITDPGARGLKHRQLAPP